MRLTTLLVLTAAASATLAPAAAAAVTAPPDWGQPGPDPSVTLERTHAGGCTAVAFRPHRAWRETRGTVAAGAVLCGRRVQSVSVLACTDIDAPNAVWPVGGLADGWSWRPLSCTAAPDAAGVHWAAARDVTTGAGCSSAYPWWPDNPTIRTELVADITTRDGTNVETVAYSRPVTVDFHRAPACAPGGGGGGVPVA
jgi:hypothetical protein